MIALPFEELYAAHVDFVWTAARRLGVRATALPDVVQDVFLIAHAQFHTLEHAELARGWLLTITRDVSSEHRRRNGLQHIATDVTVDQLADPAGSSTPVDLMERAERLRHLASLINAIKPAKREVFILFELEELSCPEIAATLSIPLNTVYSRLHRARGTFGLSRLPATAR